MTYSSGLVSFVYGCELIWKATAFHAHLKPFSYKLLHMDFFYFFLIYGLWTGFIFVLTKVYLRKTFV